jgi:phosphoribosylaminoimidazolecarboxamide formyltransferase/IMP cyclohydrolase
MIRRALISVSDKRGVVELGRALVAHGAEILSTGGTYSALAAAGVPVTQVSAYTGAPEILDGRVKTLHPKIHGGLLGRDTDAHRAEMAANGIGPIDLVVVNLYPFEATIAKPGGVGFDEAIENIDIGGPSMLRSAAKNHERVTVVVDPDDYAGVIAALPAGPSAARRLQLATTAFSHTAAYDAAISAYLSSLDTDAVAGARAAVPARRELPDMLSIQWKREYELRYGENPHQKAAFYSDSRSPIATAGPARAGSAPSGAGPSARADVVSRPTIASAEVLGGKQLSYNNLLDLDAALGLCLELAQPAAVVVKHNNPCGVALGADVASAYKRAREADSVSAFGGIVAVNREVDAALAALLAETFLECVVAPSYSAAARDALAGKKNLRLVAAGGDWMAAAGAAWSVRTIAGGALVQTVDHGMVDLAGARVATKRAPTDAERADLAFAWRVAKHVKSNAIVFAKDGATVAIGAGQMSRVDSVRICERKAGAALKGAAVASDAFFPFRDGVDVLAAAGASSVVQPGGSVRDDECIAAADEHGLAMLFTGMRHFRH